MRNKVVVLFALLLGIFAYKPMLAQNAQSAYSIFGIGDVNWGGYSQNTSMAGLGITHNARYFLNNINPAMGASNLEAVFQIGSALDIRNHSDGNQTYGRTTGGLKDLGFNGPIVLGRWNIGLSLQPYTNVGYGFTVTNPGPEGSTSVTEVTGGGGIDQVSFNNSFKVGNFLLGLRLDYIFGSIQEEDRFFLQGIQQAAFGNSVVNGNASFSAFTGAVGVVYRQPLGDFKFLNVGGYYNPGFEMRQRSFVTLENQTSGGGVFSTDTLVNNVETQITIPQRIGVGISYERLQNFAFGIDLHAQDWSEFRTSDGSPNDNYGQSYRVAVGGEILPDYQSRKFSQRITYRFGLHYEQTPFVVDNTTVEDLGISFGGSIPLNAVWGLSHLNFGSTIGQRGTTSGSLVRERYVKIYLGFSLQDVTWFSKTRFN
jgi:hypothetical protein